MFVLQPSLGACESGACRGAVSSFWVRKGDTFPEPFFCEVQGTRSQIWAGNWAPNPVPKIRPSSGPVGWDKVCASGVIRLLSQATARVTVFELEAVPGETVRPSLLGDISVAVLWLVVSVCSDFCTVLWHVIRFESTYYLCGLELAVSGCFRHFL